MPVSYTHLAYLQGWREHREHQHANESAFKDYYKNSYIIKPSTPRFGSGEAKCVINQSVRCYDLYIMVDAVSYTHLPIFTPSGITESSPIVTSPNEYMLSFNTFGFSCPKPSVTLSPTLQFSAMMDLSIVTLEPISVSHMIMESRITAVSYTHLDVYKRQEQDMPLACCPAPP